MENWKTAIIDNDATFEDFKDGKEVNASSLIHSTKREYFKINAEVQVCLHKISLNTPYILGIITKQPVFKEDDNDSIMHKLRVKRLSEDH